MARFQWPACVQIAEELGSTEKGKVKKSSLKAESGVGFDRREMRETCLLSAKTLRWIAMASSKLSNL